jgi:hypothetical protein
MYLTTVRNRLKKLCGPPQPAVERPPIERRKNRYPNIYRPRAGFGPELEESLRHVPEPPLVPIPTGTPCVNVKPFVRIEMPLGIPFVPNPEYFLHERNVLSEDAWNAARAAARRKHCDAIGNFENINLSWDLGNPNLGTVSGVDINRNSAPLLLEASLIHLGEPCCQCFSGTVEWTLNIHAERRIGSRVETGETEQPLTGIVQSNPCQGSAYCCSITSATQPVAIARQWEDPVLRVTFTGQLVFRGWARPNVGANP